MSKRLEELDVLRGIAALAVLFCHFTATGAEIGLPIGWFRLGRYGPHLFFLISGFVILMSLSKSARPIDFVVARFSRLYPVYWLAVAVAALRLWACPLPGETSPSLARLAANLTMFQSWLRTQDLNGAYWTLAVELKFYALLLVVSAVGWLGRIELAAGVWLALASLYHLATGQLGMPDSALLRLPLNLAFGQLFIAGMMFYRLKTSGQSVLRHALIAGCVLVNWWQDGLESTIVVTAFVAVFYLFIAGRLSRLAWRPLVLLGTISYPLYLLHGDIGSVVIPQMAQWTSGIVLPMAAALLVSLLLAAAVSFRLEQPATRFLRDALRRTIPRPEGYRAAVAG